MCTNENPPLCYERLKKQLKKMFVILLIVNFCGFILLGAGLYYSFKRLRAGIFFTYNMNRQTAEKLTNTRIYWSGSIKHIVVEPQTAEKNDF